MVRNNAFSTTNNKPESDIHSSPRTVGSSRSTRRITSTARRIRGAREWV